MNEQDTIPSTTGRARRWLIAAALGIAVGAGGFAAANAADGMGMHGKRGHHGPVDPATAARHIDRMVEHLLADGTPQQKARLKEIALAAHADLAPERAKFREVHKRVHDLLTQPTVDRVALEQLRSEQMARMDAISKRITTAVADAAEVLTPEQRLRFAKHMKKRMH